MSGSAKTSPGPAIPTIFNEGKVFRNKLTKAIQETVTDYRETIEKKMNDGKYYYHYTSLPRKGNDLYRFLIAYKSQHRKLRCYL